MIVKADYKKQNTPYYWNILEYILSHMFFASVHARAPHVDTLCQSSACAAASLPLTLLASVLDLRSDRRKLPLALFNISVAHLCSESYL